MVVGKIPYACLLIRSVINGWMIRGVLRLMNFEL
jgi:hypothetical protein